MLEVLGLTEVQERIYRELVAGGPLDVTSIAQRLGLDSGDVTAHLRILREQRLVNPTGAMPPRYLAAPPDLVLEPVLMRHSQRVRSELDELTRSYRTAQRRGDLSELVEILVGEDVLADRLNQLNRHADGEVLRLHRMPPSRLAALDRRENGLRHRTLYDRASLEQPGLIDQVNTLLRRGEQCRTLDQLPMNLVIGVGCGAVMPLAVGRGARPMSLFVRPSALLDSLVELFDILWNHSTPLQPDYRATELTHLLDEKAPSPDDLKLMSLMLAGLPDEAIARHLATSPRTITRRVRRLMDLTGTRTRFQLGCRVTQRGWI